LKVGDDPATRFVAEKVIELTQRGIRDPDELRTLTLREFGLDESGAPRKWTPRLRMWPDRRRGSAPRMKEQKPQPDTLTVLRKKGVAIGDPQVPRK